MNKVESLVRTSALSSYRKPSVQRRGRAVEQADRHTGLEKYRLLWRLCSGSGLAALVVVLLCYLYPPGLWPGLGYHDATL